MKFDTRTLPFFFFWLFFIHKQDTFYLESPPLEQNIVSIGKRLAKGFGNHVSVNRLAIDCQSLLLFIVLSIALFIVLSNSLLEFIQTVAAKCDLEPSGKLESEPFVEMMHIQQMPFQKLIMTSRG